MIKQKFSISYKNENLGQHCFLTLLMMSKQNSSVLKYAEQVEEK